VNPAFAIVAILPLALGVGATAISAADASVSARCR
jgi:hypothetical protein